ncbi:hypothetical protein COY93_01385 [Candidatus Uhrbacteria bacterium CG_4_10_14_0_8_um_filter_58_22]|uniref:Uncharacterized protein n=1 Tax=Candidatus Uhrbacteria bacterium CG_4_10_14_0_8_um_filter_58_22 TaxID=1975029 RepID=A0A2M7QBN9_9BACT|nr:MAG: hypothetical protein AUJ19_03795 [Parcubacteria group bacterium CG1_02_58_44]PIY63163.1 MAG: hypothetical protein COY93_01385 [Candidatus Uhrbacteria bacterium CG_4_10_14_0_8_um_filter_58_22]
MQTEGNRFEKRKTGLEMEEGDAERFWDSLNVDQRKVLVVMAAFQDGSFAEDFVEVVDLDWSQLKGNGSGNVLVSILLGNGGRLSEILDLSGKDSSFKTSLPVGEEALMQFDNAVKNRKDHPERWS